MGVKLVNNIPKIQAAINVQLAQGINSALLMGVHEAHDLAPEDTGFLKSGIGMTKAATPNDLSGEARSIAAYSGLVNYGTSKRSAQPYWTVAWLLVRQKFTWLMKSGFVSMSRGTSAGPGVQKAAQLDFFGPTGRKGGGF